MFKFKDAAMHAEEFFAKKEALTKEFIKKLEDVVKNQEFKVKAHDEALENIQQARKAAEVEMHNALQLIKEIK